MTRSAVVALGLLALAGSAAAKDLKGVFEDAVKNDPVIRGANANRLAAREARPQAWSAILPQINATSGITWDHNGGFQDQISEVGNPNNPTAPPVLEVVPLSQTIDQRTTTWAVNLRSSLISWTNWMNIKAAGAQVAQAEANYEAAEQNLILRVAQAYFNVLASYDALVANQASLEAISRQLDQANTRFDVGLIAITDVQEAKASRDTAAAAVIAAKRTQARQRHAAEGSGPRGREPLGQHLAGAEPQPDLQPPGR